jgi:hypothetical protein
MHEADQPNTLLNFLDAELLACQHDRDVDLLAVQAEATAGCDDDVAIMEGIGQFGRADIGAKWCSIRRGTSCRAPHGDVGC